MITFGERTWIEITRKRVHERSSLLGAGNFSVWLVVSGNSFAFWYFTKLFAYDMCTFLCDVSIQMFVKICQKCYVV